MQLQVAVKNVLTPFEKPVESKLKILNLEPKLPNFGKRIPNKNKKQSKHTDENES